MVFIRNFFSLTPFDCFEALCILSTIMEHDFYLGL